MHRGDVFIHPFMEVSSTSIQEMESVIHISLLEIPLLCMESSFLVVIFIIKKSGFLLVTLTDHGLLIVGEAGIIRIGDDLNP